MAPRATALVRACGGSGYACNVPTQNDPVLVPDPAGDPDPELAALVQPASGVARGSLGTGTALDDTQEYDVDELRVAARANPPVPVLAPPVPVAAPPVAAPSVAAPSVAAPSVAPVAVEPTRSRVITRSGVSTPKLAAVAAAAILVLVVGAAAVGSLGSNDNGIVVAPGGADVTAAPTDAPPADEGGNGGEGGGNGKGNGNGNGNGNGKGKDKPN